MKGVCDLCKEEKNLRTFPRRNINICNRCYTLYFAIKQKCDICGEYNIIKSKKHNMNICEKCYKVLNQYQNKYEKPLRECSICHEIKKTAKTKNGNICYKCYDPPKKICSVCKEENRINQYVNKKPICFKCYKPPKKKCSICGEVNYIKQNDNGSLICQKCYEPPQIVCCRCGRTDRTYSICDDGPICHRCYDYDRSLNDKLKTIGLLRKRLRDAFSNNSTNGKIKKADEYGINYYEIFEYLGPCPGNRKEYHIDHILPISAFDFDNPIHILAAFAPENHQWLKAEENLQKHNKYDKDEFFKYINKFNSGK